jgi:predicted esterase
MSTKKILPFLILPALLIIAAFTRAAQPSEELKILQAESRFVIDGDLADWAGIAEIPVRLTAEGKELPPSADLTVTARFSFDAEYFYAALKVLDDRIEFPDRGRREGDGFYLTFVNPEAQSSQERALIFGFSRFENEPLAILDRPGEEMAGPARDIQFQIKVDEVGQSVTYELAIPWKYSDYFRPFIQQKLGINLTYDDLDAGQKKTVQLVADPEYRPESVIPKKFLMAEFIPGPARVLEFQASLNANRFYSQDERKLRLAVHSPEAQSGWQLRMVLTTPQGNVPSQSSVSFGPGMSILTFPIAAEKTATGTYDLSLGVLDEKGSLRYTDDRRFFLLDKQEFDAWQAKIAEIKKGENYSQNDVFRESLPTLEIRLQWLKEFLDKSPAFADLGPVQQWNQEIKDLFQLVDAGKPALFPPGRMARLAYRSEADGSLRSYSLYVPDWYEEKTRLPLLVTLTGGATDERRAMFGLASNYFGPRIRKRAGDFFILAPEVEDPDSWYTGSSGERVIETIEHLVKTYAVNVKGIVLDGFSRGAYGALRLAFQNPGSFRGVIVRSGIFVPPQNSGAESLMDMLDRSKNLNILIVYGDQDKSISVEEIRNAAARLLELKANVRVIEVKGPGGDRFEKWDDVFSWLRETLGETAVDLKPPKREREKEPKKR